MWIVLIVYPLAVAGKIRGAGLSVVKTELNWALRISALSLGESLSSQFSFRGAISIESVFLCLMKVHSFLLFDFFSLSVIMDSVYDQYASFVA